MSNILSTSRLVSLALHFAAAIAAGAEVQLQRVPNNGIQPQALTDANGTIHLLYFQGEANRGDLFYVRQRVGAAAFSSPLRVNSLPGSAIAVGSIRGGQMALGREGRVHVVWNGHQRSPQHQGVPLFYARLEPGKGSFEPQRDVVTRAVGLDGGGSVAADRRGQVYVIWHGSDGDTDDENDRRVFLAKSSDDGTTFAREVQISPNGLGVCACCSLRGLADGQGRLFIAYRAVAQQTNRNSTLIWSEDGGGNFATLLNHPWPVSTCPMSSAWLADTAAGLFTAWETGGQVYCAGFDEAISKLGKPFTPPGRGRRKFPVFIANGQGERLFVWAEGTGWQKGGAVAWQLFDARGNPTAIAGRKEGIPIWSFAAAVARPDGHFIVYY